MGMGYRELYEISPRSLFNKIEGHRWAQRADWERTRLQCYYSFAPIDPEDPEKKRMLPLLQFMPLPWDDEADIEDAWEKTKAHAQQVREESEKRWAKIDEKFKN